MMLHHFQVFSRGRLFAAQPREPYLIIFQSAEERFHFAKLAALAGIAAVQNSKLRFLIGHGLFRGQIFEIQIPRLHHFVAIGIGFREVISRIQKKDGNPRHLLAQKIENDHVLGLKAARDAGGTFILRQHSFDYLIC